MGQNIVLVLTDEERAPGPYEGPGFALARKQWLIHRQRLTYTGRSFRQHRTTSCACVPSRATLFTGYSPWVHGVTQTDGMAKLAHDPGMSWLPADGLPTLGHRFRNQGYDTAYVGKWHLSHVDQPQLDTLPEQEREAAYRHANPLDPWGFSHWVGPEPHGPDRANCGLSRDPAYVRQAMHYLQNRRPEDPPFLLVVSLVNPHDIVFWPSWSIAFRDRLDLDGIPLLGAGATATLRHPQEPGLLTAYRRTYRAAYGPPAIVEGLYRLQAETYRRFYLSLLRRSDAHLGLLLDTLQQTGLEATTAVVFTSDHGELLGNHGGLHQKFYNAFEETLRVPLIIRDPQRPELAATEDHTLTEHRDLVPTLLSLADLSADHPETSTLPGRDLLTTPGRNRSYFVSLDHMLSGDSPTALAGRAMPLLGRLWSMRYRPIQLRNTAVEAVLWTVPSGQAFKLIRYFDPSTPAESPQDDWQLFAISEDPIESEPIHDPARLAEGQHHLMELRIHG